MTVDALVFDAYGTLYDVHSVAQRCESFFPGAGQRLSQLWRAKQLEYTWLRSLMRRYAPFSVVTREALAYSCEALSLKLGVTQMEALMAEYLMLSPFPEVPAALRSLQGRKAILSNGSPDMLEPLVRNSKLELDAVLSVDEVKVFKPAPEVYDIAVRRLKVAKERIGFVSSNGWDAAGAKSFGFQVFWINRAGAPLERLPFKPDRAISSLAELDENAR
jgi:2-haloacid dehalogenase